MMWIQDPDSTTVPTSNGIGYTVASVEYTLPPRAEVTLDKDELDNVIEFIELNFIESIRNDPDIDNIDYIISMMSALQKFRLAYASIKLEEESQESSQEEIK